MRRSSFTWRERFSDNHAVPHDESGTPAVKSRSTHANAAASLHTTAKDYARFMKAVLGGEVLRSKLAEEWLDAQVAVSANTPEYLGPPLAEAHDRLAWGLGWGLERGESTCFHWGANDGFRALVMGSLRDRTAFVGFTNGDRGLRVLVRALGQRFSWRSPSLGLARNFLRHDTAPERTRRSLKTRQLFTARLQVGDGRPTASAAQVRTRVDAQLRAEVAVLVDTRLDLAGVATVAFEGAVDRSNGFAEAEAVEMESWAGRYPAPLDVIQNQSPVCHATLASRATRSGSARRSRPSALPAAQ